VSYRLVDCGTCVTTNPTPVSVPGVENPVDPKQHLTIKLKKLLQDVEVQSKYVTHHKEIFSSKTEELPLI